MYENSLDGILPVDTLGQILALVFIFGLVACMIVGVIGCLKLLKRYLDNKVDLETTKWAHQLELEKKEDENWRKVPSTLQCRIKQLEDTCKNNQRTIAELKLDLASKDEFMSKCQVKDLYYIWKETGIM